MIKNELKEPNIHFGDGRVVYKEIKGKRDLPKNTVLNLDNESLSLVVNNNGKRTTFLQGSKIDTSLFFKKYKTVDLYWVCPKKGISNYESEKFELKLKYVDKKDNSPKSLTFNYSFEYEITTPSTQFINEIIIKNNDTRDTYSSDYIITLLRKVVSFDKLIQDNVQQIINNCSTLDEVDEKLKKFNFSKLKAEVSKYGIEIKDIKFDELALDDLITKEDLVSKVAEAVPNNQLKNDLEDSQNRKKIINQNNEIINQNNKIINQNNEIINQNNGISNQLGTVLSNQEKEDSKLDQSLDNEHAIIATQEKQNSKLDRIESKISFLHDYFKNRKEEQKEFKNQLTQLLQNTENIKERFEKQNLPAIPAEIIDKPLDIKKFIDEHYDEIVDSITLTPEFLIDAAKTLDDFCVYASLIYHSLENSLLNKYHLRAIKTNYYYLENEIKQLFTKMKNSNQPINKGTQISVLLSKKLQSYLKNHGAVIYFDYLDPIVRDKNKDPIYENGKIKTSAPKINLYKKDNLNYDNPDGKLYSNNNPVLKFIYAYEDKNHPENKRYNLEEAEFIGNLMNSYNNFRHQSDDCKNERDKMLDEYKEKYPDKVSEYDDVEAMKMMCIDHLDKLRSYKAI